MSLTGKTAVVTGAGSGLGRGCSIRLAREGVAVAVWDLNEDAAAETASMIKAAGGHAVAYVGDASDRTVIAGTLEQIRLELGPILILVNNAGITGFKPFLEITPAELERMYRINLMGPFYMTQAVIPDMVTAGWGRIINISSSSAQTGAAAMAHYSSSKGGIIALTKTLALEFADRGITVNNIPPGFIDTPMTRGAPIDVDAVASASPMKRVGRPEDIAAACAFLASRRRATLLARPSA